LDSETCI